jgi:hypothetical protein
MEYEKLIKKYEGKKRRLLIVLIVVEAVLIALIIGFEIAMRHMFADDFASDGLKKLGLSVGIPACIVLIVAFTLGEAVVVWQKNKVRGKIRSLQESVGITDDNVFAETVNSGRTLPALKNVYLSEEYLINLDSFWGCRLDRITDLRIGNTQGYTLQNETVNYYVEVTHDGRKSYVYTTDMNRKKVYNAIYEAWQRASAAS